MKRIIRIGNISISLRTLSIILLMFYFAFERQIIALNSGFGYFDELFLSIWLLIFFEEFKKNSGLNQKIKKQFY